VGKIDIGILNKRFIDVFITTILILIELRFKKYKYKKYEK